MCYACAHRCHAGHDVRSLWTKHAFRCDCGTGTSDACALAAKAGEDAGARAAWNDGNRYGHNFAGRFCWCDREYDDDEDKEEEEDKGDGDDDEEGATMIQCVACEDWMHVRCILQREASSSSFSASTAFSVASAAVVPQEESGDDFLCADCASDALVARVLARHPHVRAGCTEPLVPPEACPRSAHDDCDGAEVSVAASATAAPPKETTKSKSSVVLRRGWRRALCRCELCAAEYARQCRWPWLFDLCEEEEEEKEESIAPAAATTTATTLPMTQVEQLGTMALLDSVDRVRATEVIAGFEGFVGEFKAFLCAKQAEIESGGAGAAAGSPDGRNKKRAITRDDICEFFSGLQSKRRHLLP